jgi:hypothetical protein
VRRTLCLDQPFFGNPACQPTSSGICTPRAAHGAGGARSSDKGQEDSMRSALRPIPRPAWPDVCLSGALIVVADHQMRPRSKSLRAGFSYYLKDIVERRYCREPDKGHAFLSWREMGRGDVGSGPWPILPLQPTVSITGYVATQFSFIKSSSHLCPGLP